MMRLGFSLIRKIGNQLIGVSGSFLESEDLFGFEISGWGQIFGDELS